MKLHHSLNVCGIPECSRQTGCGRCEGGWEEGVALKIPKHFRLTQ